MAQGQIRKGFFFYFGLFVLLLIAVFMICLVVMMFNPGKTILWMQYFTANEVIPVEKANNDGEQEIKLENLTNLNIKCSYGQVVVMKTRDENKNGIYIVNKAKGFAGANNAVPFSYKATFTAANSLSIELTEPTGFLHLSKEIGVIVFINSQSTVNLQNLNLTVETTSGQVEIGQSGKDAENVKLKSLNVKTESGEILINPQFDASTLEPNSDESHNSFSLSTEKGKIWSMNVVTIDGKNYTGLNLPCNAYIRCESGRVNLDAVVTSGKTLKIECINGDVQMKQVKASEVKVACADGNYLFGTVDGNLSFTDSENSLRTPNISAEHITGTFTLSSNTDKSKPKISIGKVDGAVNAVVVEANVDIDEANGNVTLKADKNLAVDIVCGEDFTAGKSVSIINLTGDIKLGFLGKVEGNVSLETDKGKVTINILPTAKFVGTVYKNQGEKNEQVEETSGKITTNYEGVTAGYSLNPFKPNEDKAGTAGEIKIVSNSNVEYNAKALEQIKK